MKHQSPNPKNPASRGRLFSTIRIRPIQIIKLLVCAGCLSNGIALATSEPLALTIETTSPGLVIPADFLGLAIGALTPGSRGYDFAPTNTQLITLFQEMGLRHIRAGTAGFGTNVDIDSFFGFVTNVNVSVSYGGLNCYYTGGDFLSQSNYNSFAAQYVWTHYSNWVTCFAFGNELDFHSSHEPDPPSGTHDTNIYETATGWNSTNNVAGTAFPSYLNQWELFAGYITNLIPGVKFQGPDTGSDWPTAGSANTTYKGNSWTANFASSMATSSFRIAFISQHSYTGQNADSVTNAQEMIDAMLSTNWVAGYQAYYNASLAPVNKAGYGYRFTEANSYSGWVLFTNGGSCSFSTALWATDFWHWWAAQGCLGMDVNDGFAKLNFPLYYNTSTHQYFTFPMAYGLKAFDVGGHGYVFPLTMTNKSALNVTAYAVGNANNLYVTIVDKDHGTGVSDAAVTIYPSGFTAGSAAVMVLTDGQDGNAWLTNNATLGGGFLTNNAPWAGQWTPLSPVTNGACTVTVQAASAAIVHICNASSYAGPIQMNENGALEIFGTATNADTWCLQQIGSDVPGSSFTNWSAWTDQGGGVNAQYAGAVVARNPDGRLGVFVASTTGDVFYESQSTNAGAFNPWLDLGGAGITSLQAAVNADGRLHVFGIGTNGDIWHNSQTTPSGSGMWTGWSDLGGANLMPGFVVGQDLSGRLEVFGTDIHSNVWYNRETTLGGLGGWSGWSSLGGSINPRLQVARNLDGRLELFGIGNDGCVWHNWQTSADSSSWNGWSDLRGTNLMPGFVVGMNKDGKLLVIGVGALTGHVYNVWQGAVGSTTNWSGWTDMNTGLAAGVSLDPQFVVGSTADFRLQLFGIGSDGHVWSDWQTNDGGWSGWNDFGNTGGVTFYPGQPFNITNRPAIAIQPQNQTVVAGQSATFSVGASGGAPLSYRWQFNGNGIPGATASIFTLASAQRTNGGSYSVLVMNALGTALSSNAMLSFVPLEGWGDNSLGQLDFSVEATNAIAVAAGAWHSLALRADGTVVAWGDDSDGQCDVPATLQPALAIAGGGYHSLALQADGTVVVWGADDSGQTNVPAGLDNVMGISAGTWHSLALRRDGTVVAWGDNTWGQTNIPAGLSNVVAVAAGGSHSLALQTNGTVVAWGDNTDAEGDFAGESVVPLGLTNVVAIGAGEYHSLAVRADGTVAAWGDDSQGQSSVPVGLSNVVAVAGGGAHSLALTTNGTVVAWGANWNGQCNLPSDLSSVVGIGAGEYHSLALLAGSIPVPQLLSPTWRGSRFSVLAQTLNRMNYALEFNNSMATTNWSALATNTGNGVLKVLTDPTALGQQRFYRLRQW